MRFLILMCSIPFQLISVWAFSDPLPSPESKIIQIENFISPEISRELIQYYDSQKSDLNQYSDNQLEFGFSIDPRIRQIVTDIASRILSVMKDRYGLTSKPYQVDHCALYCRIPGNSCGYHADNIRFECPIHGGDQNFLRKACKGNCSGSRFVPNHTGWREYTALLYLNEDFQGGEILFEDGPFNKLYRRVIPIKRNLLVITPNGPDFYHEVFTIRSGKRYSMHFWFTSDLWHFSRYIQAAQ